MCVLLGLGHLTQYDILQSEWLRSKTQEKTGPGEDEEKEEHSSPLLVGLQAGTTTLEISLAVPQKTGHDTTELSCYTTPGHITRGFPSMQ